MDTNFKKQCNYIITNYEQSYNTILIKYMNLNNDFVSLQLWLTNILIYQITQTIFFKNNES